MALQTTASVGLSAEMKTFYDRTLLARTVPNLIYGQFGQGKNIPEGSGKTVEFRRFSGLVSATTPLTEGTLYTDLKDLTVTAITATVIQYGNAVGFSDLVTTTTIDPILTETTGILGDNAGETIDDLVSSIVCAGTTVIYASTAAQRTDLTAAMIFTPTEVRRAVLQLKLNRARKIDGFYHAVIHPRTSYDLMNTTEWRDAQNLNRTGAIFDGSLGTLYGVKFWETDKAPGLVNLGNGGIVDVYQTMIFGADAYGVVKLSGHNLRTIYKSLGSAGTADPLDQQQTMGWKCAFTTKILNDLFMVRFEHATSTANNAS